MCGRYSLATEPSEILVRLTPGQAVPFRPRWNIAPGQDALVILAGPGPRQASVRWGLVPSWATDQTIGQRLFNLRSDVLAQRAAFRNLLTSRRCLVLPDGFYLWARDGLRPQPIRCTVPGVRRGRLVA